jgi:hypothetical protein
MSATRDLLVENSESLRKRRMEIHVDAHTLERAEERGTNLDYYEGLMTNIISGGRIKAKIGILIISITLLCGFLDHAIPNPILIEFYTFFYVWIYLLWPSQQGERFLVLIIPFLFLYFFYFPKLI